MEALNIAKPTDSIGSACSRPGMPAKVKTALRTLLLSTSDVPGTEGRKSALRFDGRGNNLKFGAASFFVTPNFADVYHPLVLQLLEGPGKWSHLDIRGAAAVRAGGITSAAPTMPPLERMHQIVAPPPDDGAPLPLHPRRGALAHRAQNVGVPIKDPAGRGGSVSAAVRGPGHY